MQPSGAGAPISVSQMTKGGTEREVTYLEAHSERVAQLGWEPSRGGSKSTPTAAGASTCGNTEAGLGVESIEGGLLLPAERGGSAFGAKGPRCHPQGRGEGGRRVREGFPEKGVSLKRKMANLDEGRKERSPRWQGTHWAGNGHDWGGWNLASAQR